MPQLPDATTRNRDWELAYRSLQMLWARLGDRPGILERRRHYFDEWQATPTSTSLRESRQFGSETDVVCGWLAERWSSLFDAWSARPDGFVFDDAFAALFFARLLWSNEPVFARGHADSQWTLESTLERARRRGSVHVAHMREAGARFLSRIETLPIVRRAYLGAVPEHHREAILQHYGFPTDLLDFTMSYDVALYFAEGGSDHLVESGPTLGSLYIAPAWSIQATTITLAPGIMRPSLQRGIFLAGVSDRERQRLERLKLVYRHFDMPVWDGLMDIPFGSAVALGKYLFPLSDPIEFEAAAFRNSAVAGAGGPT
jgi:FRG domain-containing protein